MPESTRAWAAWFLAGDHPLALMAPAARALALAMQADLASRTGDLPAAKSSLQAAREVVEQTSKGLSASWGAWAQADTYKVIRRAFPEQPWSIIRNQVEMTAVKIESRATARVPLAEEPAMTETGAAEPVRVALYDARAAGGQMFGVDGLRVLLDAALDLRVETVSEVSAASLDRFDVLVVPDCKRFGAQPVSLNDLRAFVVEAGKGLLLEHDSCGYHRFPLQGSPFPEIATVAERVGHPLHHPLHEPGDRQLFIADEHPVTAGFPLGMTFTHRYYDHFRLQVDDAAAVLLRDATQAPVMVAGRSGRGRVVFSGLLTMNPDDTELDEPLPGPEGKLLRAAVYWLAGNTGTQIRITDVNKEDRVEPDGTYSFIRFRPEILTAAPLTDAVLTATARRTRDNSLLERETVLARIGALDGHWAAEEPLQIQVPEQPSVILAVTLRAAEGEKTTTLVVE